MLHALVIGGTGMLSGVSRWLANNSYHLSVIARNPEKMKRLMSEIDHDTRVTPLLVDYNDYEKLKEKVKGTVTKHGPFSLVVVWIHSNTVANEVLDVIRHTTEEKTLTRIVHVVGSRANLTKVNQKITRYEMEEYQLVQLGFKMNNHQPRMLTHSEICEGVINSITTEKATHLIGQLKN